MPSLSIEALVEERVAQLEVISQRRNELLREMYRMMRRRENAGSISMFDDEDEDELQDWLDRYDLNENPDSGMVSNILPSELCATSSSPIAGEVKSIELPDVIDADSPMSEPPASPRSESSVLLQVPESDDPLAASIPEGSPPRATPMSHKRPRPDDEPDELNLVAALSRSPSQRSVSHRSQSLTHRTSRSKSRTFSPRSPQSVNAVLDEVSEVQEVLVDLEERMDVSTE
jgi:chromatin modification-related protein VID21